MKEVFENCDSDNDICITKNHPSDILCLTIFSNLISDQAVVINFLTNSYVVVACGEAAQNNIIKAPLLSLHKKSLHAINSQVSSKLDSLICASMTSV